MSCHTIEYRQIDDGEQIFWSTDYYNIQRINKNIMHNDKLPKSDRSKFLRDEILTISAHKCQFHKNKSKSGGFVSG